MWMDQDSGHDPERMRYPGGFLAGDDVRVIDGIFGGMLGKVVTPDEARELRECNGGDECRYDVIPGRVWVALVVFGRCAPAMLEPFQIRTGLWSRRCCLSLASGMVCEGWFGDEGWLDHGSDGRDDRQERSQQGKGTQSDSGGEKGGRHLVMHWRSYLVLMLSLVIASCWLVVGRQQGISAEQGETPRDAFDIFADKIDQRRVAIQADLKTRRHKPWEGIFSDGSPIRGLDRGWMISRKNGYVSTTRRCDMGNVKVKGNRIALVSEAPNSAWGLTPVVYVVVPWEGQVFLVEPSQLLAFCNSVNSGKLRRFAPTGQIGILLRVEDFGKKRLTGLPKVPSEYEEYVLRKPIIGTVVKKGEEKQDVAVWGEDRLMNGTSLILNVGKKDGVRTGMQFYPERDSDTEGGSSFFVISLTDRQCELLQYRVLGKVRAKGAILPRSPMKWVRPRRGVIYVEDRVKVGLRMTTADPYYDRE